MDEYFNIVKRGSVPSLLKYVKYEQPRKDGVFFVLSGNRVEQKSRLKGKNKL